MRKDLLDLYPLMSTHRTSTTTGDFTGAFGPGRGITRQAHIKARGEHDAAVALTAERDAACTALLTLTPFMGRSFSVLTTTVRSQSRDAQDRTFAFLVGAAPEEVLAGAGETPDRERILRWATQPLDPELEQLLSLDSRRFETPAVMADEPELREAMDSTGIQALEKSLACLPVETADLDVLGFVEHHSNSAETSDYAVDRYGHDRAGLVLDRLRRWGLTDGTDREAVAADGGKEYLPGEVFLTGDGLWVAAHSVASEPAEPTAA